MEHIEKMWSFVENQRYCLSLTNIAHFHTSHDPFITSHCRFPHLCGILIIPLWGVYRECKYKLLNFFHYPSISYKIENNPLCHVTLWRIATDRWKSAKWPNFAKSAFWHLWPLHNMSSLIDSNSPSSMDWEPHSAFIIPGLMRKSTLVLPVEYQNQVRLIKSAKPSSLFLVSLNANQNPLNTMIWWKEARMTVPAMTHGEIMRQFVENQRSCLNSPNIAQMHTWPFHNKSFPIRVKF